MEKTILRLSAVWETENVQLQALIYLVVLAVKKEVEARMVFRMREDKAGNYVCPEPLEDY